jgi:hypothetical protein
MIDKYVSALKRRLGRFDLNDSHALVHAAEPIFSTIRDMVKDNGMVTLDEVLNVVGPGLNEKVERNSLAKSISEWATCFDSTGYNWDFEVIEEKRLIKKYNISRTGCLKMENNNRQINIIKDTLVFYESNGNSKDNMPHAVA